MVDRQGKFIFHSLPSAPILLYTLTSLLARIWRASNKLSSAYDVIRVQLIVTRCILRAVAVAEESDLSSGRWPAFPAPLLLGFSLWATIDPVPVRE